MTLQRILTAAVLIPLVLFAVLRGPAWLVAALTALVTVLALREFFDLATRAGLSGHVKWTLACSLLLVASQHLETRVPLFFLSDAPSHWMLFLAPLLPLLQDLVLIMFVLGVAALSLKREVPLRESVNLMGSSSAGMLFVALPLSFLVRLHGVDSFGPRLVLFLLVLIWVGDTFAYFVGRSLGRHLMAPQLSPKKTWEGAIANLIGSLLVALMFSRWLEIPIVYLVSMATLGNVAGQLGDLTESAYKRAAGAKDSSALLPGHGGVLDRIDSLIFATPVVWYSFVVIARMKR